MQLFGERSDASLIEQPIGAGENSRSHLHDDRVGGSGDFLTQKVGHSVPQDTAGQLGRKTQAAASPSVAWASAHVRRLSVLTWAEAHATGREHTRLSLLPLLTTIVTTNAAGRVIADSRHLTATTNFLHPVPMKIAYLAAGAAGRYCGTCLHDNTLAAALTKLGVEILLVPTYTPLRTDEESVSLPRVFFGGVNVYLQQKSALFRHTPWFFDSLLRFAATVGLALAP